MMKYDYEYIDIDDKSVAEVIAALQAWETENPDATDSSIGLPDHGYGSIEITFQRPMTETEIVTYNAQLANSARYVEERDRAEYDRLKTKFEGN